MTVQELDRPAAPAQPRFARGPGPGELAPAFQLITPSGEPVVLRRIAGLPTVVVFYGSLRLAPSAQTWSALIDSGLFDGLQARLVGVSLDPQEPAPGDERSPGWTRCFDPDRAVSRKWGVAAEEGESVRPIAWVLDRGHRVLEIHGADRAEPLLRAVRSAIALDQAENADRFAPVVLAPRIFEPELCRKLIEVYQAQGGEVSGFMREIDGKTTLVHDPVHKRRKDAVIDDPQLCRALQTRIHDRLAPVIEQAFGWRATRMERYIVARYGADEQGFFRAHRDNTTAGTAHRKFAVTINLNAGDYEGGDLRFPEYGPRTYRAPTGGAVVFGCGLLHEATPVTKGERFAFLPFLYDEEGALTRERNSHALADPRMAYKAGSAKAS